MKEKRRFTSQERDKYALTEVGRGGNATGVFVLNNKRGRRI